MTTAKVLVIGGGVAGSSCALTLARHRISVDLVEKASFPRTKVCGCCIGPAGLTLLDRLRLHGEALQLGSETNRWSASIDRRRIDIPIPSGLVISREALDPLILNSAIDAGAKVTMNCEATVRLADSHGVDVRFRRDDKTWDARYEVVVVAAGLSARGLDQILPWTQSPHGPFGYSCTTRMKEVENGTIYMACQEDGYVGLVQLADGKTDVAAALRSGSEAAKRGTPIQRIERILAASAFGFDLPNSVDDPKATPPLRRSRLAGNGRVLAIGDAAGYVEPFTGEGMTWAIHSGIAASDLIAHAIDANSAAALGAMGQRWTRQLSRLLRRKKMLCRTVTSCLGNSFLRAAAGQVLSTMPQLSSPIIRSLNRI
jgi:flavin-dependent dehydrogenase